LRRYHDEPSLDMGLTYSESNAVPKVASMNIEASSRMDEENVRQDKRPREDEFTRFVGFFNKIQLSRSRLHSSIMWVLRVKDLFFASYMHLYTLVMLMYHLCLRDLSSMILLEVPPSCPNRVWFGIVKRYCWVTSSIYRILFWFLQCEFDSPEDD